MDSAMVKLSNALDLITLPDGAGKPMIMEVSMDMMPVIYASVDYEGKDIYELSDFVENTVVPTMERQNGVASVNTTGAIEKTVEIRLNQEKIDAVNDRLAGYVDEQLADAKAQNPSWRVHKKRCRISRVLLPVNWRRPAKRWMQP